MYVIPLIFIVLIALAIFFSPILAVILLVVALLGIGALKYFGRGVVDPEHAPPPAAAQRPGRHLTVGPGEDEKTGAWGETWPEEHPAGGDST
jgi:hypothetical protein